MKNFWRQDYQNSRWIGTWKKIRLEMWGNESVWGVYEKILYSLYGAGVTLLFAYFFYRKWISVFILWPIGIYAMYKENRICAQKQREILRRQFADSVLAMAAQMKAGYSIENSVKGSLLQMQQLYGEESFIYRELYRIVKGIEHNISLEKLLVEMAEKWKIEEIKEFSEVFQIAKQTGGDLPGIMLKTANHIKKKEEMEKEIRIMIAGKQMEWTIMTWVPFGIIGYVSLTSPGYFKALYESALGILVMSSCLVIYILAYLLGNHITDFEI